MKLKRWPMIGLGLFWMGLETSPAAAQHAATADALYEQGRGLMKVGVFKEACPLFQDSYRLDPAAGTLFMLAECRAQEGRLMTAVEHYEEYLKLVQQMPSADQAKQVQQGRVGRSKEQLEALRPEIPKVSFVLPVEAPAGTRVSRDGVELSLASLSVALPLDPGEHVVRVLVPGREAMETRFSVAKGETKAVELLFSGAEITAPEPPKPVIVVPPAPRMVKPVLPARPEDSGMSGMRMGAYGLGGVGLLGLGVGAALGGLVLSRSGNLLERCPRDGGTGEMVCRNKGDEKAVEEARGLGTIGTLGLIGGGAALAGGAVLWLLEPKVKEGGFSSRDMSGLRLSAHAALGAGLLSMGMGAALGGLVWSEREELLEHCRRDGSNLVCGRPEDEAAMKQLQGLGTLSTVGLIGGGVSLAGGVILWLMEPKSRRSMARLEVLGVDSKGAFLGVKGEW